MSTVSERGKTILIVLILITPVAGALLFGLLYHQETGVEPGQTIRVGPPMPEKMGLWEGAAKGYVKINYSDPKAVTSPIGGFLIRSTAPVPLVVSEYPMILSPNPLDFSLPPRLIAKNTTQDGALTPVVAPAYGNVTYVYGAAVTAIGVPPGIDWGKGSNYSRYPPWWCSEVHQYTRFDTEVFLAGQIVPDPLVNIIISTDPEMDKLGWGFITKRQQMIWDYMNQTPTLVAGKKPMYIQVEPNISRQVNITIAVTNIGFRETKHAILAETIPPGFGYAPGSFAPAPSRFIYLYDGSVRVEWEFYMPAATPGGSDTEPSNYTTRYFAYTLVIPALPPSTRYFVPGSQVDTEGDLRFDAHSADLLIETVQTFTTPMKISFPEYPWWVFVLIIAASAAVSYFIIRKYRKLAEESKYGSVHSRHNTIRTVQGNTNRKDA